MQLPNLVFSMGMLPAKQAACPSTKGRGSQQHTGYGALPYSTPGTVPRSYSSLGRTSVSDASVAVCVIYLLQTNFDVSIDIKVNNTDSGVSGPVGSTLNYQVTL